MKNKNKKLNAISVIAMFMISLFAGFVDVVPLASAATGDGEVTLDVKAVTIGDSTTQYTFTIINNGPKCLDEFFIEAPDNWVGQPANLVSSTNLGVLPDNNADPDYTDKKGWENLNSDKNHDDKAIRIQVAQERDSSDNPEDGFCPGATATITIDGLTAPSSESYADFGFWTSEVEDSNQNAQVSLPGVGSEWDVNDGDNSPLEVVVSSAVGIKKEYLRKNTNFEKNVLTDPADGAILLKIPVEAFGADARLESLKLRANDASNNYLRVIWAQDSSCTGPFVEDSVSESGGIIDIDMNLGLGTPLGYTNDVSGEIDWYCVVATSSTPAGTYDLDVLSHTEDLRPVIDGLGLDTYIPPVVGTAPSVDGYDSNYLQRDYREVRVRLVDGDGYDVPILGGTALEVPVGFALFDDDSFCDAGMYECPTFYPTPDLYKTTDDEGGVTGNLYVGQRWGAYRTTASAPGLSTSDTTTEWVAFDSGVGVRMQATDGDGEQVESYDPVRMEVTLFDQYDNVVTDTLAESYYDTIHRRESHPRTIEFAFTSPVWAPSQSYGVNGDQQNDDDSTGNGVDPGIGKAVAEMNPYHALGHNIVTANVVGTPALSPVTIDVEVVLGQAGMILLDCPQQMFVGDTPTIGLSIVDANGNQITDWRSLVDIRANYGAFTTSGFDELKSGYYVPAGYLQGWTYDGLADFTYSNTQAGTVMITAKSDTLLDGSCEILVRPGDPASCEINLNDTLLHSCEINNGFTISQYDQYGNLISDTLDDTYFDNCYDVSASCGDLSTEAATIYGSGNGYSELIDWTRGIDECLCSPTNDGWVTITATEQEVTCEEQGGCPINRNPIVCSRQFRIEGEPYKLLTEFESINPANQELVEQGKQVVSEEVKDNLKVVDYCGYIVSDFYGQADVELKGTDCVDFLEIDSQDLIQSPLEYSCIMNKIVVDNCADEPQKKWLPLELDDIMVDKLAYKLNEMPPDAWIYVYAENENEPGLQIGQDPLVGKAPVSNIDEVLMELRDSSTPFADDQRQGGLVVRAGDTRDFYAVLASNNPLTCEDYDIDFKYMQDYNSPDLTSGPGGNARDGCIASDNHNWKDPNPAAYPSCGTGTQDSRNDDYLYDWSSYPQSNYYATPSYGFGDRVLYGVDIEQGLGWFTFRDLVAEDVDVFVTNLRGGVCNHNEEPMDIPIEPQPEEIEFISQLATQIELLNHDRGEEKTVSCSNNWNENEAFHLNIQTTDGFENPHAKEIDVKMDYCLKVPFGSMEIESMIEYWCVAEEHCSPGFCDIEVCEALWMDEDKCYTRQEFKDFVSEYTEIGQYMGGVLMEDFLGEEISEWIDSYFDNAEVKFWRYDGYNYVELIDNTVRTDSNGQAEVWATSAYAGRFKVTAKPLALDGASTWVQFMPSGPASLEVAALPGFGVPADGEEEAILLLRALDKCENIVRAIINDVTVTAESNSGQAIISQDFDRNNNYDNDVTGRFFAGSVLGFTHLAVMDDIPEIARITASSPGLGSDTTQVIFQGAPVKLAITKIEPSDRLPADGETGAWVTIQVQDANNNRVTGYLGDGFRGDPGDPWGMTDFNFNEICIDLDDGYSDYPIGIRSGDLMPWEMDIEDQTLGWNNLHGSMSQYCGDLLFGEGKIYVVADVDRCMHGGTVQVKVWDDMPYQGQEMDENGLPMSVHATQLDPAMGEIDFVDTATEWKVTTDKIVAPADGVTPVRIDVQVRNPYMDVRQSVQGNVFVGGTSESGAILSWNGEVDELNPSSMKVVTDPITGRAQLELTSTQEGKAEITVTGGKAWVCFERVPLGVVCPICEPIFEQFDCHYSKWVDLEPMNIEVEFTKDYTKIDLDKGWNLMSLPWTLDDPTIQPATAGIEPNLNSVWYYDATGTLGCGALNWCSYSPSAPPLTVTLNTMEPGKGYWIEMSEEDSMGMVGQFLPPQSLPPTYPVLAGWNLVGFHSEDVQTADTYLRSLNGDWSSLYEYVEGRYHKVLPGDNMIPGRGYWLYSTSGGTIAI